MTDKLYYICRYAPLELFAGFGTQTERLDPAPLNFDCADGCSHPNLCGFGKAVIEDVAARGIKRLLLTDCCDVCRRLLDVLERSLGMDFIYLLPLPHKAGNAETKLLAADLKRLAAAWTRFSGQAFDYRKALEACSENRAQPERDVPHVSLAGAHGGSLLFETVKERFKLPVTDDTCTGARVLAAPQSCADEESFFAEYAAALLNQTHPCMRMYGSLGTLPEDANARGVVFHTVKFCDYYSFEYHNIKNSKGAPILKIETDCTPQSSGQLRTRLDAFAETLDAGVKRVEKTGSNGSARYTAGVDSGSTSTDAVVMDANRRVVGSSIIPTGAGAAAGAAKALAEALAMAGLGREDLAEIVTTGYGRENIGMTNDSVTEITCHARGAHFLCPDARTVIDIGGQDSKVIRLDERGHVVNFVMNDKCAAGTGRFLELMARTLEMPLEKMGRLGLEWKNEIAISSMCTVFAESEVVSLIANNTQSADIIHGLNMAVAGKTASLAKRLGGGPRFIMTGGVAQNPGVVKALEEKLGSRIYVPKEAQLCGAIGAALIALEGQDGDA